MASDDVSPLLRPDVAPLLDQISVGLADPVRLQLLAVLLDGDHNVTALTSAIKRPQPSVSKHLRILRDQQLVHVRRERNTRIYRLALETPVGQAVAAFLESLESAVDSPQEPRRPKRPR